MTDNGPLAKVRMQLEKLCFRGQRQRACAGRCGSVAYNLRAAEEALYASAATNILDVEH